MDERAQLDDLVRGQLAQEARWTRTWSFVYHASVFGAATLSALAAVLLQLKSLPWGDALRTDVATIMTAVAALIGVVAATGGFERKWRANRLTRSTLEQLQVMLTDPQVELSAVRRRLVEMKKVHNLSIIGGENLAGEAAPGE